MRLMVFARDENTAGCGNQDVETNLSIFYLALTYRPLSLKLSARIYGSDSISSCRGFMMFNSNEEMAECGSYEMWKRMSDQVVK